MWCWWCCHSFDNTPLQIPTKYDQRRNKFTTCGNFCSWSCMKTYAVDKYGLSRGCIIIGNMTMMRKRMYSKVGSIKPAPNRLHLKEFGGTMSIEEFRINALIDEAKPNEIEIDSAPDLVIKPVLNTSKMYEIKGASGTNEALRLKRAKPLKRDQNNLESVLGLVIKQKT